SRLSEAVSCHLRTGVILVGLFGGAAGDEARPLVVVGLGGLHVADCRVLEIAEHAREKRRSGHMVRVEGGNDLVPVKADSREPGVVVAVLGVRLKGAAVALVVRYVFTAEV